MIPILTIIGIIFILMDKTPDSLQKNLLRWVAGAAVLYGGLIHV